ncbi:MAG TPA: ROK family protein [Candidatus Saccharimonadia bacterium]
MHIGVDIGGSKILVVAGTSGHAILRQAKIKTPESGKAGMAEIIRMIEEVAGNDVIRAIAIATASPIDRKKGRILESAPNMHGWRGTELVKPIKERFSVPIYLENDAAAAALTESHIGAGRNHPYVLYVTISTGIGTALVINGQPYRGGAGSLEAGHMIIDPNGPQCGCGGRGHFEAMVAGPAIRKRYGKYGYEITDPEIWDEIAGFIALGFYNLIHAYAPSVIVIGGGVGVHYEKFHPFLVKHLEKLHPLYPIPPIVPAKHIETAVGYGALILASQL